MPRPKGLQNGTWYRTTLAHQAELQREQQRRHNRARYAVIRQSDGVVLATTDCRDAAERSVSGGVVIERTDKDQARAHRVAARVGKGRR